MGRQSRSSSSQRTLQKLRVWALCIANGEMIHIQSLIDEVKCFETIYALRWPNGVCCLRCESFEITKQGRDDTQPARQRYSCPSCERRFDDLTDTIFTGHHQPLRV